MSSLHCVLAGTTIQHIHAYVPYCQAVHLSPLAPCPALLALLSTPKARATYTGRQEEPSSTIRQDQMLRSQEPRRPPVGVNPLHDLDPSASSGCAGSMAT